MRNYSSKSHIFFTIAEEKKNAICHTFPRLMRLVLAEKISIFMRTVPPSPKNKEEDDEKSYFKADKNNVKIVRMP